MLYHGENTGIFFFFCSVTIGIVRTSSLSLLFFLNPHQKMSLMIHNLLNFLKTFFFFQFCLDIIVIQHFFKGNNAMENINAFPICFYFYGSKLLEICEQRKMENLPLCFKE